MRRLVSALALTVATLAACGDNAAPDACLAMQCHLPDPPTCSDGATLVISQFASCAEVDGAPKCDYSTSTINCAESGEVCSAGACHAPGDPCVGATCDTPPAPSCSGDTLTTYDAAGTCDGSSGNALCSYPSQTTDCAANGQVCAVGTCVDRCNGVTCDAPPAATCGTNGDLTTYSATGTCNTGTGQCDYTPSVSHCTAMDKQCDAAAGACVDPCATNPCTTPPADFCDDATHAHEHKNPGTCTSPAGVVACDYDKAVDCGALNETCAAATGQCADPCVGFACTTPPADFCDANGVTLEQYAASGTCSSPGGTPGCDYGTPTPKDCSATGGACSNGACVDVCTPNPCTTPPADFCDADGITLEQYPASGTCSAPSGTPSCDYGTPTPKDCSASGGACSNGACIDVCTPNPCTTPPADFCIDPTHADIHLATGVCSVVSAAPSCDYDHTVDCGATDQACDTGACVDPCVGFSCTTPPAATCGGAGNNVAQTFAATGTCTSPGGAPTCGYAETDTDCSLSGQTCDTGACTGPVLFVRLQFPGSITDLAGSMQTVYGRIFIQGVTDASGVDDPVGANVKVQLGVGTGSDPTAWTWTDAIQNATYGPGSPGYEANNDEYQAMFIVAGTAGTTQSYGYRLSNDGGTTWLYGDSGAAGSSDGFTTPGLLTIAAPYFSEYIEGSSNNKALEIYNPGSTAFSLAGCEIFQSFNGGTSMSTIAITTGASIAPHDVWTLCNTSYALADSAQCDQKGAFNWNGDDAIVFRCGTAPNQVVYDSFGQVGVDPGTNWGTGNVSTLDHTLLRDCSVLSGDTVNNDAFDPSVQWAGYAQDSHFLGSRNCPLP